MALAAVAVDAGLMYGTKRHMQAAADAAVMAGLPYLATATTAQTNAKNMRPPWPGYCGWQRGATTTVTAVGAC